jgi:hypothetical protein
MRATPSRLGDRGESATRFLREELGRAEIIPASGSSQWSSFRTRIVLRLEAGEN